MNKTVKIIISWILVILWMGVIFTFSSMDSDQSNSESKGTIDKVVTGTIEIGNNIGITNYNPTIEEKEEIIDMLNFPVRKLAHMFLYFVLAILLINALKISEIKKVYIITIIIVLLYAITDEFHQTLINGRTGKFIDVLIDTTGSLIGMLLTKLIKS